VQLDVTRRAGGRMNSWGGSATRNWCFVGMSTRVITRTERATQATRAELLRRKTSDWRRKKLIRWRERRLESDRGWC
jgi:hypothetical protein